GDATSRQVFLQRRKALLDDIGELAAEVHANRQLAQRISDKFRIRNTTGYSLNALVDFDDPIDILQHLMIGSEGTLGFISQITYRTVDEHPHKATALLVFADVQTACEVVTILRSQQMSAVELMDRACLRAVENKPGLPDYLAGLPDSAAALLVETRAADSETLYAQISEITKAVGARETLQPVLFTDKPEEYEQIWNVRRGLYPSVGAMRATGTSVITEDLVFPVDKLASAVLDLRALLEKYDYEDAMILGHALQGNIHIVFSQAFTSADDIARYQRLLVDITAMVVERYDGSLKGEHGTGRNMAPFVELEWGAEAYALMRRIKTILDPINILNPGVILNDDPRAHLKNLKPLYPVDPLVDKCIECGMCESSCPSAALTLSPRQRITGLREIARLSETGEDTALEAEMQKLFRYQAVDTCAGDSLCAAACPVGIDTGQMMKGIRGRESGSVANKLAGLAARNFAMTTRLARIALGGAGLAHRTLGTPRMQKLADAARRWSGGHLPAWNPYAPTNAGKPDFRDDRDNGTTRLVYFPACSSRVMGPARGDSESETLPAKAHALFRKAGFAVVYPQNRAQLCCGMAFESKGMMAEAGMKLQETATALLAASREGRDPVVIDTSPCALRLKQHLDSKLTLLDITEFIHDHAQDRLTFHKRPDIVAVHATCSTRKMGSQNKLEEIARLCADHVVVPEEVKCCGWGGDKGFTQPELNASALRKLAGALPAECTAGYSTSRTCEIGLSHHSERYYRSIVYLVDRCTTARQPRG
ncbi:MAG: FAD-binding and (Fe-S)-binding domain-containing protein, partial [Gammaproteobacteria bacterium]